MFADPILSKQMAQGKLTKSSIDRFTIVLMGGIAAEAINYGSSEVRGADINHIQHTASSTRCKMRRGTM